MAQLLLEPRGLHTWNGTAPWQMQTGLPWASQGPLASNYNRVYTRTFTVLGREETSVLPHAGLDVTTRQSFFPIPSRDRKMLFKT